MICSRLQAGGDGTVRIGLVPSVSSLLFPCCRRRWRRLFRACGWSFTTRPTMRWVAQLLKGQIDFWYRGAGQPGIEQLDVFLLQEDPALWP